MTYDEALEYIHSVSNAFCKPGLERTRELCRALGNPERELKFIHVGGTNGKGSFCSMLDSVLRAEGYRVGLYTSPYIVEFGERMRINGECIPRDMLVEITELVKPIADRMKDRPTEFELITAIAFEYFRRMAVDVVILEVGLGGRLDSTNVISSPLLSVITGISLDHTAILGDTVEKIALEKAGIIKDGAPVLFGGTDESAYRVISDVARERGSRIYRTEYSKLAVKSASLDRTLFDFKQYRDIELHLLGEYQPRNAASVLSALDILRERGIKVGEDAVRQGLAEARWQARFEIISREPLVIFDGAHNPEGIEASVRSIEKYFPNESVYVLSGVLRDKDYKLIAKTLSRVAKRVYTMTPENPRALCAEEYKAVIEENGIPAVASSDIQEALLAALRDARADGVPLVCLGSLYTYGTVYKIISERR